MVDRGTGRTGAGGEGTGSRRLIGWKAIGQFLRCTERTARRWEAYRGMPVHRIPGGGRSSVWATPDELSGWLQALPSDVQATLRAEVSTEAGTDAATQGATDTLIATGSAQPTGTGRERRRMLSAAAAFLLVVLFAAAFLLWNAARHTRTSAASVVRGPYDDNTEARETYMTARFELATRSTGSLAAAEQAFHDLTRSYPDRAAGWSGLADTYLLLREFGSVRDEAAYTQAERAARTALALDPKLADAWLDQAFIQWWWHGDPASAFRGFNTALQLEPRSAKALHWYATALYAHGDYDQALQTIGRARELDPNNRAIVADEAWLRFGSGERTVALMTLERQVQHDPGFEASHYYLAHVYLIISRDADFLREAKLAAQLRGQAEAIQVLRLVELRFRSGGRAAMLEQLSASEAANCDRGTGSPVVVAGYRALANDRDGMLKWLTRAEITHDHNLPTLRGYPEFEGYRKDPEFVKIVQRLP
ncbi:MAG TPA: tetratricopeptide repeat protein [Steroidobacteraceae bacterium]